MSASESPGKGCRALYPGPPTLLEQERSARLVYLCQFDMCRRAICDFRGYLKGWPCIERDEPFPEKVRPS